MIKPLTSLRFFFALMVFVSHLPYSKVENKCFSYLYNNFFIEGYLGVNFFFILSGFILAFNYKDKIIERSILIKDYLIARIARIYPLHVLTLLIAVPLSAKELVNNLDYWLLKFGLNTFLLQSYVPDKNICYSFNGPSWSISDELFFYCMFPLVILATVRFRYTRQCLILGIISIPILMTLYNGDWLYTLFYINPVSRFFDFAIGIILYDFYIRTKEKYSSWSYTQTSVMEVIAIIVFVIFFIFHDDVPMRYRYSCYYWIPMILIIYSFSMSRGAVSKILSANVFILLGEISFAFYLLHALVIRYYTYLNSKFHFIENDYWSIALISVLILLFSYMSHRYFELPMNKYLKRHLLKS